jgi:transcriptional regulator with XRE-family HTH domain
MTDEDKKAEPVDVHVGAVIRRRRRELGMGQEELASALGVSAQQIQKYESANTRISASKLFLAAVALKVPAGYFFSEIDDRNHAVLAEKITANVSAFLKSSDGKELAVLFPKIEDGDVRKQFLNLARAFANTHSAGKLA